MSSPLVVEAARAWLRGREPGGGGGGGGGALRERVAWRALEQSALERRVTALETRSSSLATMVTATTRTTAPNVAESSERRRAVGTSSSTCQTDAQSHGASQRRNLDIYIQRHHLKRSISTEEPAAAPIPAPPPPPPPHRQCLDTATAVPPSSSLLSLVPRPPPKAREDAKCEHGSLTRVLGDVKTNKETPFRSGNEWKKFLSPEMFTVMPMSGLVPGVLRRARSPTSSAVEGRLLDLEERIKILEKSIDVDRGAKSIEDRDIEEDSMFVHPDPIALERCRSVCQSILGSEVDISITAAPSWHRRVDDTPRAVRGCTVSRGVTADDASYGIPEWERTHRTKMGHEWPLFCDEGTDAQLVAMTPKHVFPQIGRRFSQSVGVQYTAYPMMYEVYTQASDEPKDESEHQQHTGEDGEFGEHHQEKDDQEPKPHMSKEEEEFGQHSISPLNKTISIVSTRSLKSESGHRRHVPTHKSTSHHSIVSQKSESGRRSQANVRKSHKKDDEPVYHSHARLPSISPWMEPWKLRMLDHGMCCKCGPHKQCLRTNRSKYGSMMERSSRASRYSEWGPLSEQNRARSIVRVRTEDDVEPQPTRSDESISDPRLRGEWSAGESEEQVGGWGWRNPEDRHLQSPDGRSVGFSDVAGKSSPHPGHLAMGSDMYLCMPCSRSDMSQMSMPLPLSSNGQPPPTPGAPPPTPSPQTPEPGKQDTKRTSLGCRPGRDGRCRAGRSKRGKACKAAKAAKATCSRRRFSVCVGPASHRGVGVVSVDVYTGCPPRASRPVVSNCSFPRPCCAPVPSYCLTGCNGGYQWRNAC